MKIDGQAVAASMYDGLRGMPVPRARMVVVLMGAAAQSLSIGFDRVVFSSSESQDTVLTRVQALAVDSSVGGIILQLPVPPQYDRHALIRAIGPAKDVDNLSGQAAVLPPSVRAVEAVLTACKKNIRDYIAVRMVGNGVLVGAPIARFCAESGISYEVTNSRTENIQNFVRDADLVITGVGKAGIVNADWLRDGAGAIDFGFPPDFNQVDLTRNAARLAFYTPTPNGTGPILVACLFENFYSLCGPQSFQI